MTNQSITVSHSGKQHSYQHAFSLQRLDRLQRFITSSYYRRDCWPDKLARLIPRIDAGLQKRWLNGLDSHLVTRSWWFECREIYFRNLLKNGKKAEEATFLRDANFDRWVAKKFAADSEVFWGFQGSCLESLNAAGQAGKKTVCEFATAHVTSAIKILSEESEKHPEWASTINNLHFPEWYRERLEKEPAAADYCIAASSFTKQSLTDVGVDPQKVKLLPLASDVKKFGYTPRKSQGPLKVLFVGSIGQRKGIKYLFKAIEELSSTNIQLQLLGPLPADQTPLADWSHLFEYLGRTNQDGVVDFMHQADILVLPSVFEGFGLVIVEAMATGMPVIASTHSCGPEVIREGIDGFVLAPDDSTRLAEKIAWCADHRAELLDMGVAAHERAQSFSWQAHTDRLQQVLATID